MSHFEVASAQPVIGGANGLENFNYASTRDYVFVVKWTRTPTLMIKNIMKNMLKMRSTCWFVLSTHGMQVSSCVPGLQKNKILLHLH